MTTIAIVFPRGYSSIAGGPETTTHNSMDLDMALDSEEFKAFVEESESWDAKVITDPEEIEALGYPKPIELDDIEKVFGPQVIGPRPKKDGNGNRNEGRS